MSAEQLHLGEYVSDDLKRPVPFKAHAVVDLPDVGRYHSRNTRDTEKAAAEAIAPALSPQRQRVLDAFAKAGSAGLTDYEGHALARLTYPHIFATRRSELMAAGYPIADSNERRQTPSGRLAIVWVLNQRKADA